MNGRLGKLDGDALERRYRERGQAYLQAIARRLQLVAPGTLSTLPDDAERAVSPTDDLDDDRPEAHGREQRPSGRRRSTTTSCPPHAPRAHRAETSP